MLPIITKILIILIALVIGLFLMKLGDRFQWIRIVLGLGFVYVAACILNRGHLGFLEIWNIVVSISYGVFLLNEISEGGKSKDPDGNPFISS